MYYTLGVPSKKRHPFLHSRMPFPWARAAAEAWKSQMLSRESEQEYDVEGREMER